VCGPVAAGGARTGTRAVMQWWQGKPYNMRIPSRPDAAVMNKRWFSILFVAVFACAGPVHAQDEPPVEVTEPQAAAVDPAATGVAEPPAATDATATAVGEAPAIPEPAAPAVDEAPITPDFSATPVEAEPEPTGAGPDGVEPATVTPVLDPAAVPVTSVGQDDRVRSMFILVSAVVLITTLIAIIVILLKRSRDSRQEQRRYVAEAFLRDVSGSTTQGMYKLGIKPVMLGRVGGKDTEFLDYIVIPSATIGRRHALIEFKDFGYWVMDQGSINGTFVNDRPVSAEVRLKHGDRLRLHKLEFEFVMPELGESGVTVLAKDGVRPGTAGTAAAAKVQPDFVLEPEPDYVPGTAGKDLDGLRESVVSEEDTLMPASSAPAKPAQAADDETLLPASGDSEAAEETLLPASSGAERGKDKSSRDGNGKKGDEIFDITGGD